MRCSVFTLLLLFILLAVIAASIQADTAPALPDIAARAYLLVDADSGSELAGLGASERLPPASLTKLMTAYVLFGELRAGRLPLDQPVAISARAAGQPGARMFLRAGETVPAEALFKGMLVQSGNDATLALVEHLAPDPLTFVARMNSEAARLGLDDTHFTNVSGLSNPGHYTTARDLARLAVAVRRDYPEYAAWFALREFSWAGIHQPNRNTLLGRVVGVDGLKTGHTEAAGFCLAASAERDGMRLIAIVLGTENETLRSRAGRQLLDYGFRHYETRLLYRANRALVQLPLWLGAQDSVGLAPERDIHLTLERGTFDRLQARALLPPEQRAPVTRGAVLGRLLLTQAGQPVAEIPLLAQQDVAAGGLARRTARLLQLWWREQGQVLAAP